MLRSILQRQEYQRYQDIRASLRDECPIGVDERHTFERCLNVHSQKDYERRMSTRIAVAGEALFVGFSLMVFVGLTMFYGYLQLLAGMSLTTAPFFLSLVSILVISLWYYRYRHTLSARIFSVSKLFIVFMMIIMVSITLTGKVLDVSSDSYHSAGVYYLTKGWNPVRGELDAKYGESRVKYYVKGAYFYRAVIAQLTKSFEQAKSTNLILIAATFFTALSFLLFRTRFSYLAVILLSGILALNPVSATGMLSTYVDSDLMSALTILILGQIMFFMLVEKRKLLLLMIAASLFCLVNTKVSGFAFAVVISGGFGLYQYYLNKSPGSRAFLITIIMSGALGVLTIGESAYVQNLLRGDPFYPASLVESDMKRGWHKPTIFLEMNRFQRMFFSLFSRSHRNPDPPELQLKLPFTLKKHELIYFAHNDVRIGGFGPLFSGSISLMIVSVGLVLFLGRGQLRKTSDLSANLILIFASLFVSSQLWPARYSPQVFLLPWLSIVLVECVFQEKHKVRRIMNNLSIAVLALNALLVIGSHLYHQYGYTMERRRQLWDLFSRSDDYTVSVDFTDMRDRILISEGFFKEFPKDFSFTEGTLADCDTTITLSPYGSRFCLNGK